MDIMYDDDLRFIIEIYKREYNKKYWPTTDSITVDRPLKPLIAQPEYDEKYWPTTDFISSNLQSLQSHLPAQVSTNKVIDFGSCSGQTFVELPDIDISSARLKIAIKILTAEIKKEDILYFRITEQ